MAGRLTTHVLDTAQGRPAPNMAVELWLVNEHGGDRTLVKSVRTNAEGRTTEPLLLGAELKAGFYELVFGVGEYYLQLGVVTGRPPFLWDVPVRIGISDTSATYHVPLLVSPWAYSTYRGS